MRAPTSPTRSTGAHWLIERRVRVYPLLFLAMFVLAVPIYALSFDNGVDGNGQAAGSDFITFWAAGRAAVLGHGLDAWDLVAHARLQQETYPALAGPVTWGYPPPTLLFVTPLGLLPHLAAFLAWTVAGVGVFLWALRSLLADRRLAWPLALAFPGLWIGIGNGQIQFFVGALLGGALLMLPRRPASAGVLFGLLVIKPHLAILVPIALLAGRSWRAVGAAAATSATAMAAALLVFGPASLGAWLDGMRLIGRVVEGGDVPTEKMVTPFALLHELGLSVSSALSVQLLVAAVTSAVVYRIWRLTDLVVLRMSALILGTFLATPYAMDYDLAILAFPVAGLALLGVDRGWRRGDRNLLVAAWLLPVLAAPIASFTHLVVTPFILAGLLATVLVRAHGSAPVLSQTSDPRAVEGSDLGGGPMG